MHLKSLIIKGFKTFAEKEELDFESGLGITAIVGPNGCGKSNVVDAFRFALGESNIRGLRVHALPEVIFAGTQTRKPLSLAEASLVFDNSDGTLPLDYSEISVKRRTFRDGESEFIINSQVSRLKDIRDLFLDSGLSTESISIMSQGNVDAVLSSKPEERRAVFEEVAGISKYKSRKLEAERKLILSEQNLLRISDLKVEVSEQMISLESQAAAAKEYKEIQEKLRRVELAALKKQARLLLEKKNQITLDLESLKRLSEQKEEDRRKLFDEKMAQSALLRQIESEVDLVYSQIEEIKNKIEQERGNLILERERNLFQEKSKLRDLKEEGRFSSFEISRIENNIKALLSKKEDLVKKGTESSTNNLEEFYGYKEIIQLTVKLQNILKSILVSNFGKSWEELREDPSYGKFRMLLDAELVRIEEEIEASGKELEFKKKNISGLQSRMALAESGLLELEKQTQEFIKIPSGNAVESLNLQKEEKLQRLDELKKNREQASLRIEELEKSTFSDETGQASMPDLIKQEIALAKIDSELAQIETHLREEYNFSFEELLNFAEESQNISKSKKEIEEFKIRLRQLEPVNLLAIDEYEKCKERHSFIESQHQDIVMARENLKTLINELDLKAREDFLRSMEVLTKNFSEVFSELFDGGEAQIVIEKEKDALEAGIDIQVQPPHRKWLGLSLLSGGERALTAIALLFAILRTSPSPLCILDEVDAALDDANVVRFASYLKKHAQTSQIIVITHNKRTMAVADTIYGITMEEPGVSKVVSMKLEKIS